MTLGLSVIGLLVLLALGAHVGTAMGLVSSAMVMSVDGVPLTVVAQTAFKSINSYPLMAIPMFVLMGNLMMRGNIVAVMIELIGSLVRCVRGGLALTVMLACVFFAAVSGSSVGSAAAIGAATVDGLKREHYPPRFSAALVAVGGTLGLMIPPSLGFILIGSIVGLPVDRLFVAGIVPGLMEAGLLLTTTVWLTRRHGYGATSGKPDVAGFVQRLPRAAGALSMPVLVLGSIYMGIFTPTEVSAVAAGYAAVLCVLVYRTMNWGTVWKVSQESILQSTMIFMVVMGGSLIGFILARMGVSASLIGFMERMDMSAWQFLLLANVVLLMLGMFLDGVAMIVLTAPLLFPMATHLGVDPVHFAVIMVANVEIATLTPPIGLNLFVMSGIARIPVEQVARGVVPFYATRLVSLALITYVPALSLALVS
ncbi:TRAP transporter large permease [Bordetella petrii]|uniref:TRAP transporter large permease protein n=1 Tax=Bordetella petrii (strain ATCC BAA-461 / DSM 12804 / CCUG 43448 / CIP 107267 / Se-1111R) TaxID=340100 RepID=A9I823_BORPD|nr:TRAP transporter large permease [Bordetella petrii]CAP41181.1 putative Membrane protein [Bordetella petrii]